MMGSEGGGQVGTVDPIYVPAGGIGPPGLS